MITAMKKVYISGKISGLHMDDVTRKFDQAEKMMIAMGFEPMNPLHLVPYHPDTKWETYMAKDLMELQKCNIIYLLHDWEDSQGARLEHEMSKILNLEIWYAKSVHWKGNKIMQEGGEE